MSKRKVLYISHNHPSVRPGGAEGYAFELYEGMRESAEFVPILLARTGWPDSNASQPHLGSLFGPVNDDANQYFVYTDGYVFDDFYGTTTDKEFYTKHFDQFLRSIEPDIVHFQHTLFLGYDLIRQVKNSLPGAKIVYTLHEFIPICHSHGQMLRTQNDELCDQASPQRCHDCFPGISAQSFFMRKRFIQSHLSLVDLFLAPSQFLMERYVAWGLPPEKIRYEENGRRSVPQSWTEENNHPRPRLGYIGQFNHHKGVHVLLRAMRILAQDRQSQPNGVSPSRLRSGAHHLEALTPLTARENSIHLWLHGANLELTGETYQEEFRELLSATADVVTLAGRYDHMDLPRIMENLDWIVVPSIWWENSPLVIQEAFQYGRPVICSDIGGMAEKVTDGVNGLHFRTGDPASLADTIRKAVVTPGLWNRLHKGIPESYRIEDHIATLSAAYRNLLDHEQRPEAQGGKDPQVAAV